MKKIFALFFAIILCICVSGCGTVPGAQNEPAQNIPAQNDTVDIGATDVDDRQNTSAANQPPLPRSYEYTTAENIHDLSETVTNQDGVSVQIISYEITSEFGNRKKENLNYENVDENGNLIHGEAYVFVTVQFSNPTDKEIEFLRNGKGLCFIDDRFVLQAYVGDGRYIDEFWTGGTPSEVFHYCLASGETITTEVGYIVPQDCVKTFLGQSKLCYIVKKDDVRGDAGAFTDPSAVFIDMSEK